MSVKTAQNMIVVALIGNPNTGKSTLFSALAGVRQQTGNYPGVTVEKKIGHMADAGQRFELVDLPGTYSLAPRSPDEMVTVDVLLGRRADQTPPDAVLCIVDASNLERNLYLVSQVLELGLPTVLALNMTDVAEQKGIVLDVPKLRERLGVPVVELQAHRKRGLAELKTALAAAATTGMRFQPSPFPPLFQQEVARLQEFLGKMPGTNGNAPLPRYLVERLLLDSSGYLAGSILNGDRDKLKAELQTSRNALAEAGSPVPAVEAVARYGWVGQILEGVVSRPTEHRVTATDRIDRVLTHKVWGTAIFALVMLAVFTSIFLVAKIPMDLIGAAVDWLGELVEGRMAEGPLRSLLVDGIIAGVGGVVIFLPQIMFLFFFIAVLEDCGYMARAAYLMDKLMVRVGLSGKSFIPLLSSFACAIPGVMAARVIENRRDRLTTVLIAPLMSCSARLPVYTVMIGAFIPASLWLTRGLTMFAMYLLGIVTAAVVALLLKRTLLKGPTPPFVMELPTYKWPSPSLVLYRMCERGWAFIARAGTLILAVSIVIWALLYYPHDSAAIEGPYQARQSELAAQVEALPADDPRRQTAEDELQHIDAEIAGDYQRQSLLGRMGHAIEPLVRPLGWDWRIGCAAIASFPAREVIIGTLGVIYNQGEVDLDDEDSRSQLERALQTARWDGTDRPVYNLPVALSIMVFFALCAQCAATLAVIKRETNSWRWPAFTFAYMTSLAYVGALVTYQAGMWLAS
ncbi:MAG: ferrous iron transport protein B [Pirellulales bacterium]